MATTGPWRYRRSQERPGDLAPSAAWREPGAENMARARDDPMRWNLARPDAGRTRERPWSDRLETVGRFLDEHADAVRDVAVVAQGDQIIVSALMLRLGTYHSGWSSVTFAVSENAVVPIEAMVAAR